MLKSQVYNLAIFAGICLLSAVPATGNGMTIRYFSVAGHKAFIAKPQATKGVTPWVWYAPTFVGSTPNSSNNWLFDQLLAAGVAVAGIDIGESYGSPAGRAVYTKFYDYATTTARLNPKPVLLAQSRGGLMLYNWAVEHADKVKAIAGIYPVCDLRSYPGVNIAASAYGMTPDQLTDNLSDNNPIDRLTSLAKANVPIFHIHGDRDVVVPLLANSQALHDRYTAIGGQINLVVVPGKGHEEAPEFFQSLDLLNLIKLNTKL